MNGNVVIDLIGRIVDKSVESNLMAVVFVLSLPLTLPLMVLSFLLTTDFDGESVGVKQ